MTPTENMTEHDIVLTLATDRPINRPWLENQAIKIEEALAAGCPDILGPSVTANFEENGWELDLTILASSQADAYDKLGQVFRTIEEIAEIEFVAGAPDEVRASGYAAPEKSGNHSGTLATA